MFAERKIDFFYQNILQHTVCTENFPMSVQTEICRKFFSSFATRRKLFIACVQITFSYCESPKI